MAINVFDFFSGCGGTSQGLKLSGFNVVWAIDNNKDSIDTFKRNHPNAIVECDDIRTFCKKKISKVYNSIEGESLFTGCAPCQPFSKQNRESRGSKKDERKGLITYFGSIISEFKPEHILMENVPGIMDKKYGGQFQNFLLTLKDNGYNFDYKKVKSSDYGVPQRRERLVLVASRTKMVMVASPTHGVNGVRYSVVEDWISDLPRLAAGETDLYDPDHRAAKLSDLNLQRIRLTPEGGGRASWPEQLILDCHKSHKGHSDVYGRLSWNKLASGLTTKCTSLSNGRFGHPSQDRAISLREAACLQTFPRNYKFCGSFVSRSRQIGNAVPPRLAEILGKTFL